MISLRDRLIKTKTSLSVPCNEEELYSDKEWHKEDQKRVKPVLDKMTEQIRDIEQKMNKLLDEDEQLSKLYQLACSVKGVGLIVAINIIVVTNEFKSITEAKKMACQAKFYL